MNALTTWDMILAGFALMGLGFLWYYAPFGGAENRAAKVQKSEEDRSGKRDVEEIELVQGILNRGLNMIYEHGPWAAAFWTSKDLWILLATGRLTRRPEDPSSAIMFEETKGAAYEFYTDRPPRAAERTD